PDPRARPGREARPEGPPSAERGGDLPVEKLGSVRLVGAGRGNLPLDAESPGPPLRLGRRLRRDRVLSPGRGVVQENPDPRARSFVHGSAGGSLSPRPRRPAAAPVSSP